METFGIRWGPGKCGIHGPIPYKFIGFGGIQGPKPCKFIGFCGASRDESLLGEY